MPSLLGKPDAVYWDKGLSGEQKRDAGLIYVWDAGTCGAGKIVVRVDFKAKLPKPDGKGRMQIMTNTIRSARLDIDPDRDLSEQDGYIKIKGIL